MNKGESSLKQVLRKCFSIRPNADRDEKLDFLRKLSIFSVPSRYPEAFGLYVIEALAAGVPVVLPESGAFPELVEQTQGGRIYQPNEPDDLAGALELILENPEQEKTMGLAGHESVSRDFSNEQLASVWSTTSFPHREILTTKSMASEFTIAVEFSETDPRHHALYKFLSLDGNLRTRISAEPGAFGRHGGREWPLRLAPCQSVLPLQKTTAHRRRSGSQTNRCRSTRSLHPLCFSVLEEENEQVKAAVGEAVAACVHFEQATGSMTPIMIPEVVRNQVSEASSEVESAVISVIAFCFEALPQHLIGLEDFRPVKPWLKG